MELDELKQAWMELPSEKWTDTIIDNPYKHNSPLAALKTKFKWTIYLCLAATLVFIPVFLQDTFSEYVILLGMLWVILLIEGLFALVNLNVITKLENYEGTVRENVAKRIILIKTRLTQFLVIQSFLYLTMSCFIELSMIMEKSMFEEWHLVHPAMRIVSYILFLSAQLVIKRKSQQVHYGKYLDQLQSLSNNIK